MTGSRDTRPDWKGCTGGRNLIQYRKKKASFAKCGVSGVRLQGVSAQPAVPHQLVPTGCRHQQSCVSNKADSPACSAAC